MRTRNSLRLLTVTVVLIAGLLLASCSQQETTAQMPAITGDTASGWVQLPTQTGGPMQWSKPPKMILDKSKDYRAIMQTEKGL